jgi:hypothetical protein
LYPSATVSGQLRKVIRDDCPLFGEQGDDPGRIEVRKRIITLPLIHSRPSLVITGHLPLQEIRSGITLKDAAWTTAVLLKSLSDGTASGTIVFPDRAINSDIFAGVFGIGRI